jgi:hypothetical protein
MTNDPYITEFLKMKKRQEQIPRAISSAIITPFVISAILIACTPSPSAEEAVEQKLRGNELCYGHNGLKRIDDGDAVCNDGTGIKL